MVIISIIMKKKRCKVSGVILQFYSMHAPMCMCDRDIDDDDVDFDVIALSAFALCKYKGLIKEPNR